MTMTTEMSLCPLCSTPREPFASTRCGRNDGPERRMENLYRCQGCGARWVALINAPDLRMYPFVLSDHAQTPSLS